MSGETESPKIAEIGKGEFDKLITVLGNREGDPKQPKRGSYNLVGWGGASADLKAQVEKGLFCPAAAFAVVAEGITRHKKEPRQNDNPDSMRELAKVLVDGSEIYNRAKEIDEEELKSQIGTYIKLHGGVFNPSEDWPSFIQERATRLKKRANNLEALDNAPLRAR